VIQVCDIFLGSRETLVRWCPGPVQGTVGMGILDLTTHEDRLLISFSYQDCAVWRSSSLPRSHLRASTHCSPCDGFAGSRKSDTTLFDVSRPPRSSECRVLGDRERVTLRSQSLPHQSGSLFKVWLTRSWKAQDRPGGGFRSETTDRWPSNQDRVVGPPGRPGDYSMEQGTDRVAFLSLGLL
jgi:hypothetical protein